MFYSSVVSTRPQQLMAADGDITVPASALYFFIRAALRAVPVDEAWYIETYPDVRRAIGAGELVSAKEHFIEHGYFEGRLPYKILVDDEFYLKTNADVAEAIAQGHIPTVQYHFDIYGCKEGRTPFEGFDYFAASNSRQSSRLLRGRGMLFGRMRNRHSAKNVAAESTLSSASAPLR